MSHYIGNDSTRCDIAGIAYDPEDKVIHYVTFVGHAQSAHAIWASMVANRSVKFRSDIAAHLFNKRPYNVFKTRVPNTTYDVITMARKSPTLLLVNDISHSMRMSGEIAHKALSDEQLEGVLNQVWQYIHYNTPWPIRREWMADFIADYERDLIVPLTTAGDCQWAGLINTKVEWDTILSEFVKKHKPIAPPSVPRPPKKEKRAEGVTLDMKPTFHAPSPNPQLVKQHGYTHGLPLLRIGLGEPHAALRKHQLLTQEIREAAPKLGRSKVDDDAVAIAKYFCPYAGTLTWYLFEYDGEDNAFGYCIGSTSAELSYFSMAELAHGTVEIMGTKGIPAIERDCYWKPQTLAEIKAETEERFGSYLQSVN